MTEPDITARELAEHVLTSTLPSPSSDHATVEEIDAAIDAALVTRGVIPSQAQLSAEHAIEHRVRYTNEARPSAEVINAILDIQDETNLLATNELDRAMNLQSNNDSLNLQLNEANARRVALSEALEIVADTLREEAVNRGWCDEYETFVDNVNCRLPAGVPRLQYATETYDVRFKVTCTDSQATELESVIDRWLLDSNLTTCSNYKYETSDE